MSKPSKEHIAVKQVIANELGVTKELIRELVEKRVDRIVTAKLVSMANTDALMKLINNAVTDVIERGIPKEPGFSARMCFKDYVGKCVKNEVAKQVKDRFIVTIKDREDD